MSEIVWKPTGDDLDDDAYAVWEGLMLRAEQMDRRIWWWAIYDQSGQPRCEQLAASYDDPPLTNAKTAHEARTKCESAARKIVASRE